MRCQLTSKYTILHKLRRHTSALSTHTCGAVLCVLGHPDLSHDCRMVQLLPGESARVLMSWHQQPHAAQPAMIGCS